LFCSIIASGLIQVYPNPAKNLIGLIYPPDADGLAMIEIMDAQGRAIMNVELQGHGILEIEVQEWPRGIYLARLLSDGIFQGECRILLK
jgi:hypothetical protein